jgi:hypothetical protein
MNIGKNINIEIDNSIFDLSMNRATKSVVSSLINSITYGLYCKCTTSICNSFLRIAWGIKSPVFNNVKNLMWKSENL